MSYLITRRVNVNKQTMYGAENNVRPLIFGETYYAEFRDNKEVKKELSKEDFIKKVLMDFDEGNFHSTGSNCAKFRYAIIKTYEDNEEAGRLHKILWSWDNTYSKEEKENAKKELADLFYKTYASIKDSKGAYGLSFRGGCVYSITPSGTIKYNCSERLRKKFKTYEEAFVYKHSSSYRDDIIIEELLENN